jgi:WD40 repeat protein
VAATTVQGLPLAVTGSDDRSVRAWDLTTGSCLATFHLPDAVSVITATSDGTVLLGVGHEVVALGLTLAERRP